MPLTQVQMRDIACIAVIGLIAHDQREGIATALLFPDFRETGKKWAGITGSRITQETGLPPEIIVSEIQAAVERERKITGQPDATEQMKSARVTDCAILMQEDLAKQPLHKPVKQ